MLVKKTQTMSLMPAGVNRAQSRSHYQEGNDGED
jgi:hypothetical protein